MTRELKLALIVGFSLVLLVTVLVSDHLSKARRQSLASPQADLPLAMQPAPVASAAIMLADEPAAPVALASKEPSIPVPGPSEPAEEPRVISQAREPRAPAAGPFPGAMPERLAEPARTVLAVSPQPKEQPAAASERTHVVADGETLFQIARKYYGNGNSWSKIAQYNGIRAESLKPGMKLRLPGLDGALASAKEPARGTGKAPEQAARADYSLYTVKPGDTLDKISRKMLGSPARMSDLLRLNGIEDGDTLNIGQNLKIPNS